MKTAISTLAFCLAAQAGIAQQYGSNIPIKAGFDVQVGGSLFLGAKHNSYEKFRGLYNERNKGQLSSELNDLRPGSSISYGGGAHIGPLYLSFVQYNTTATSEATLKDGSKREFRLEFKPLDMNFDLMFPVSNRARIGMALALELQRARLYSGYRYPNGYLSYAEDKPLNGVYDFFFTSLINLGVRVDVDLLKRKKQSLLALSLRVEHMGFMTKFLEGKSELLPIKDQLMVNVKGGGVFSDGDLHNYLPVDPGNANNTYAYYVGLNECFNSTYKGWRISANLIFIPLEWTLDD